MKTLEINNVLKADLLLVELQTSVINSSYHVRLTANGALIKDDNEEKFISNKYTLLGKPDEISEEDAAELVEPPIDKWGDDKFRFLDYCYDGYYDLFTATESLMSALETQVYWENPIDIKGQTFSEEHQNIWQECESRTFDRSRTLIFVKS